MFPQQERVPCLTLPDPPSVNVDLHGEARVQRLVVVQDEDVAAKGVNAGGVHRGILGNRMGQKGAETDYITSRLEEKFSKYKKEHKKEEEEEGARAAGGGTGGKEGAVGRKRRRRKKSQC